MKNDVGYLEHGEMIRLGTILKVNDGDVVHGDVYFKVTSFESYPVVGRDDERSFSVNAEPVNGYKGPAADYTKSELQDLVDNKALVVFN